MNQAKLIATFFLYFFIVVKALALPVIGKVTDENSTPLSSSSIYIKNSSKGTTANAEGNFAMDLPAGNYTLVCSHVGFTQQEKKITVTDKMEPLVFILLPQKQNTV